MSPRGRLGAVVLVLAVLSATAVADHRADARAREWEHGGDDVAVRASVGVTDESGHGRLAAVPGRPRRRLVPGGGQGFVVDVTWEDAASDRYAFLLLDRRTTPPTLIGGQSGRYGRSTEGGHWSSSYTQLAEHYPWLARTAPVEQGDGSTELGTGSHQGWSGDPMAVGASAAAHRATLVFWTPRRARPVTVPQRDLVLAMVRVGDDGGPRWARQVPLEAGR